jgi:predicted amidohydrolase YtcJ
MAVGPVKHAVAAPGMIRSHAHGITTTMIYTHVLNKGGRGVTSPMDVL